MLEKLKGFIGKIIPQATKIKGASIMVFYIVLGVLMASSGMYIAGCVQVWWQTGKPPLADMKAFIDTLGSPAVVAAIVTYVSGTVDADADGESDMAVNKTRGDK